MAVDKVVEVNTNRLPAAVAIREKLVRNTETTAGRDHCNTDLITGRLNKST